MNLKTENGRIIIEMDTEEAAMISAAVNAEAMKHRDGGDRGWRVRLIPIADALHAARRLIETGGT